MPIVRGYADMPTSAEQPRLVRLPSGAPECIGSSPSDVTAASMAEFASKEQVI